MICTFGAPEVTDIMRKKYDGFKADSDGEAVMGKVGFWGLPFLTMKMEAGNCGKRALSDSRKFKFTTVFQPVFTELIIKEKIHLN